MGQDGMKLGKRGDLLCGGRYEQVLEDWSIVPSNCSLGIY